MLVSLENPAAPLPPTRVLIVDDDDTMRRAYGRALERSGFFVQVVEGAEDALVACRESRFDVVLSDLLMPGKSGLELLGELELTAESPAFVLMTGNPGLESAVSALELGAVRYLQKPVKLEALSSAVSAAALRTRQVRRDRQATKESADEAQRLVVLNDELDRALSGLWMAFQPIAHMRTGVTCAYEALLRTSSTGAFTSPVAIIDAAERLGRVSELGARIRTEIAASIPLLPVGTDVYVNLHPDELSEPGLFDPTSPLAAFSARVVLEITERASADEEVLLVRAAQLRKLGYRLAVDDFGAGASGLLRLSELRPQIVKLDRALIRGLTRESRRFALVAATVALCEQLGALPLAEGVETEAEREACAAAGCLLVQGYLLGKPARAPGLKPAATPLSH